MTDISKQAERTAAVERTAATVLATIPPVWDTIRVNLRLAATGKFGISLEQFHVLRQIRRGHASVGQIAAVKQISKSAASQAVEALALKGLVARSPNGDDRRFVRIELTPYATSVLEENLRETREWMTDRMGNLSPKELKTIEDAMIVLGRVFAAPDAEPAKAEPDA
jgi:Transcriptional regulators